MESAAPAALAMADGASPPRAERPTPAVSPGRPQASRLAARNTLKTNDGSPLGRNSGSSFPQAILASASSGSGQYLLSAAVVAAPLARGDVAERSHQPSLTRAERPSDEFYEPAIETDDPRWSGENWLLMRAGSGAAAQAPGAASYGASQAGAIVRYRFGRGDRPASYGYLRTSLAINAPGKDKEIALGLGVRPVARVPVRVLAEARLQDTSKSPMQVRPVATAVTEIPWVKLPLGLRADVYAQGGYAGGRGATPFFDAQAMIDRPLRGVISRNGDLRIGAGVWSGGQKGAVRLDAGPRLSFRIDVGKGQAPTRIALDWRFRLAGNARPGSGPAATISSAF